MRLRLLAFAAPLVLLGACAATSERSGAGGAPTAAADTAYGMFLAGNAALAGGRSDEAARFLDLARTQSGGETTVTERAFTAALLAGDVSKAAVLAPDGATASEPGKRMGRLVSAVELIAVGKGKQAHEQLTGEAIGFPHRAAAALLAPWAAAQGGDVEGSLVRPQVRGDPTVDYFGQLGQAHLYERAKRYDEAETDFKAITAGDAPSELAVLAYGAFLERRGRRAEAIKVYDGGLERNPASLGLTTARARAAANKAAPPAPTIKEGSALALLAPAATMIAAKQGQIGLAYLRLALRLDPQRNDAWLMVGDFLQGAGDVEGAPRRLRPAEAQLAGVSVGPGQAGLELSAGGRQGHGPQACPRGGGDRRRGRAADAVGPTPRQRGIRRVRPAAGRTDRREPHARLAALLRARRGAVADGPLEGRRGRSCRGAEAAA
ncbi:tetratricopeptide repeat protein [Phenylobacterium sp. J426]|uniref:tetratricopeptide repeat protein n=1 Tax=Phenylobacterium sp. J426 TaxID=2898439 RepID=UPI0035AEB22B